MIAATKNLDEVAGADWDVVVIGAGPAGAVTARQSALLGHRTLLVDGHSFPRYKVCGACLNAKVVAALGTLGLNGVITDESAIPLGRFRIHSSGRSLELPLSGGVALSRVAFDAALVNAAISAGAAFVSETWASLHGINEHDAASRSVELKQHGQSRVVQARIAILASGLNPASMQKDRQFVSRVAKRAYLGAGAMIEDSQPGYTAGTVYMAVGATGYVGVVRTAPNMLNVAASIAPRQMEHRGGLGRMLTDLLHMAGLPGIAGMDRASWKGTLPLTRTTKPVAGHRVFVVGDAAGYVEPFTGEGIGWALTAASNVVPLLDEGVRGWRSDLACQWIQSYRKHVQRKQRICRVLSAGLRSPLAVSSLLELISWFPWVSTPLLRRVNGRPASFIPGGV